jgi:hypothetical protein
MWKPGWLLRTKQRLMQQAILGAALLILMTGCAVAGPESGTAIPTVVLIPATATSTPLPVIPTATLEALPAPADFMTPTLPPDVSFAPVLAQPLLQDVLAHLAAELDVSTDHIQLLRLESALWTGPNLGCRVTRRTDDNLPEVPGYRMVLAVDGVQYEYHTDNMDRVQLCPEVGVIGGQTDQLLLDIDPLAMELVALAQRRLAAQLDLPTSRIRVVDVMPFTWTDSSLNCPRPGQEYAALRVDGYRIVLAAGDNDYLFHSDSTQLSACDPRYEQLPD